MQAIVDKEGGDFKLASWDWWYYAEKVKKAKYDLGENELRADRTHILFQSLSNCNMYTDFLLS